MENESNHVNCPLILNELRAVCVKIKELKMIDLVLRESTDKKNEKKRTF